LTLVRQGWLELCSFGQLSQGGELHKGRTDSVLTRVKVEIDEELWYGVNSDDKAEGLAAQSMAARMGRIIGAKPFPAAAQRLSQLTQNPNCQMDDVVGVLESDPALSARLLRLVNSVGFSLRTACTSVRHAATLVGTEKLNQVASTAAILDMYESGSEQTTQLLEHATVVGTLCRYLGFHFGLQPDELFTCGFLHDIGKLMLLDTEGDEYLELLRKEDPQFDTLYIEERKQFGFDHALLAGHVLAAWHIPHPVPKVVAWHHHVTRAYAESTEISQLVSTLRLADAMSYALERTDTAEQIQALAKTEAASYMDISEGQLAAMWEEVRGLTRRARAVFRGEKVDELEAAHTSRPSAASLRAVAVAKARQNEPRILTTSIAPPTLSERPRQFPCVVCDAPSYAHRCSACHGYVCPLHMGTEDEWCQLCQKAYREEGIPRIRPAVSTLLGATLGGLLAAAFFGAASAGAQRPMKLMVGPTLILMLLGMLLGVGHRWVRRWWFLRRRPNRASLRPRSVEAVLDIALEISPEIRITELATSVAPAAGPSAASAESALSLSQSRFPAPPAVPILEASNRAASFVPAAAASEPDYSERYTDPPRPAERSDNDPSERPSEPMARERESDPYLGERESDPYLGERRSDVPAHRPSRSISPQGRHWMSSAQRTPRPRSEMPGAYTASSLPPSPYEESLPERREALPAELPVAAALEAPVAERGPARSAISLSAELTSSILALEQALSDAPAPLAGGAVSSRAPKSSRRPSRRASRPPSVAATRVSRTPSHAPAARVSRGASAALAAPPVPVLAAEADPLAASAPQSAVLPVGASQPPAAEAPESGWRDVLDLHGTASGW
jgi:HD-like signal output (HDOD) protein